ncbi:Glyoxylate/hydroxypyruvate reductase B [Lysinibacillus sphaericus]
MKNGKLWAAGLDVFEQEPVALDHPLLTLPNVVVLPHIGSASLKTRTAMLMLNVNALMAYGRVSHFQIESINNGAWLIESK